MLSFAAANRAPAVFPDFDCVIVDSALNRHAAFGLGIHRWIGSTVARMEMCIALDGGVGKFPDFELKTGVEIGWSVGTVRGPRQLPVILGG